MENEIKDEQLDEKLTELDPPYESKEELMIGRLLDQYGIPFFFTNSLLLYTTKAEMKFGSQHLRYSATVVL